MRITLQTDDDAIDFTDARNTQLDGGYCMLTDTPDGLGAVTDVRESMIELSEKTGALFPSRYTMQSRTITIPFAFVRSSSTLETGRIIDRINAMAGIPLDLILEDERGWRSTRAFIASFDTPTRLGALRAFTASIILKADALFYGRQRTATGTGDILCPNEGNAPTYPTIKATDYEPLTIRLLNDHTLREIVWNAYKGATLDLATLIPTRGTLSNMADLPLPPQLNAGYNVSGVGDVTITWRPAWRG